MMSCTINSGITARSGIRKTLNQVGLNNYRTLIIESDNLVTFSDYPPSLKRVFLTRHMWRYNRINDTFSGIGCQRGQAVTWSIQYLIDNKSIQSLNSNKIYSTIDQDNNISQLEIIDYIDILYALFNRKNLYHNQVIFIDVRWCGFEEYNTSGLPNRHPNGYINPMDPITMSQEKGNVYRAGTISKESINYVNDMIYLDINPFDNSNPIKKKRLYI